VTDDAQAIANAFIAASEAGELPLSLLTKDFADG
jgi:hypothetical protein